MNIEDSVIILKNIKKLVAIEWKHHITDTELSAIETLLTAYEKEKEERERIGKLYYEANENCIKYEKIIEKQQKEIEELKNEVMEKELIIDGMKEDRRIAVEEIQEEYFISKDKIKAKIEEVNIKLENYEADKINIFSGQTYMEKFKLLGELYGLQSLLEKE